ncbi:MAG TPA: type II secretion system protein GspL [Desulfuromonadales bacterium]|nr:type II secretion system protein GspL [Desulfuromonadales bacterium]
MAKRLIGIDIDAQLVRVAIATDDRGQRTLTATMRREWDGPEELATALREMIGEPEFGDRIATALPAGAGFIRWLTFPFADSKKIEAALDFELGNQLPVSIEGCVTSAARPRGIEGGGFRVAAAAVRNEAIAERVAPCDAAGLPVQSLDLLPFAAAAGLREQLPDGLLILAGATETSVALVASGQVVDFRLLPRQAKEPAQTALLIVREAGALRRASNLSRQDVVKATILGSNATLELREALQSNGLPVELPTIPWASDAEAEFLPALVLAQRAALGDKDQEFNFRRGAFALRSEWAALKKRLAATAILLGLAVLVFGTSATLAYRNKAAQARKLEKEMSQIFRTTFPGNTVVVDIPLQMTSKINDLKKKGALIGMGNAGTALSALREISSHTPTDVTVDVRELNYSADGVRLAGVTSSFDAVNKLARSLQGSPLFQAAQITDAKMSIDGSKVDFHINLTYPGKEASR